MSLYRVATSSCVCTVMHKLGAGAFSPIIWVSYKDIEYH